LGFLSYQKGISSLLYLILKCVLLAYYLMLLLSICSKTEGKNC